MKSLSIALGTTLCIGLLVFLFFSHIGATDKVSGPLAGAALGFFTFIHDKVDKALSSKGASKINPGIIPMSGFELNPWLMFLYVFLTLLGSLELISGLFGVAIALGGASFERTMGVIGPLELPFTLWLTYLMGRWAGVRSGRSAYWIGPLSFILVKLTDTCLLYMSQRDEFKKLYLIVSAQRPGFAIPVILFVVLLPCATADLGAWIGNRVRFGAYLNSLLRQISFPAKDALLSMAYEEARANPKPGAVISA